MVNQLQEFLGNGNFNNLRQRLLRILPDHYLPIAVRTYGVYAVSTVVEFRKRGSFPVAALNIKDPEVHELAMELARRTRSSLTEAVKHSLRESIARQRARQTDAQRLVE